MMDDVMLMVLLAFEIDDDEGPRIVGDVVNQWGSID